MDYCEKIFGIPKVEIPTSLYKQKINELFARGVNNAVGTKLDFLSHPEIINKVELIDKERLLDFLLNDNEDDFEKSFERFKDLRIELLQRYLHLKVKVIQDMENKTANEETYWQVKGN